MEIWSYSETNEYVSENFTQSLALGLNVIEATERALYEFDTVINESEIDRFFVYLTLAKAGIEQNQVRADVVSEIVTMLTNGVLGKLEGRITGEDLEVVMKDVERVNKYGREAI
ncbi:hypothetical protein [Cohnella cholangitidis]|uniref:Uncharacterized protein n=1 Tax=Cohnella cholangitidis TaxID=2598458 RepID=A0A7G5BTC0_9BACL|nr:hypothetical protein [Cohnella cholangitidis]QMV40204.1 hypothetical protein FPL14_02555 [Cohnella cholangitidis]